MPGTRRRAPRSAPAPARPGATRSTRWRRSAWVVRCKRRQAGPYRKTTPRRRRTRSAGPHRTTYRETRGKADGSLHQCGGSMRPFWTVEKRVPRTEEMAAPCGVLGATRVGRWPRPSGGEVGGQVGGGFLAVGVLGPVGEGSRDEVVLLRADHLQALHG